ncbi:DUF2157 domain-containing protein [Halobacillus sp. KGW1]|uniref:DUF2157 domain-containing protein n=1 Tax=Halobacillus sp. KGW1 TaxID=1793726 RepID=UPI0007831EFE|nr:DUF2157 domain-containing protein [Halobacillus sp. KGW1]
MNREQLNKESKKWVEQSIITESQREQLMGLYPKKQSKPMLVLFAAIFIGLGFLTFVASNWSYLTNIGRMAILIVSLLGFYVAGEQVYHKRSKQIGTSLIIVAVMIFGASLFLIGQMYHYSSYSALPFFLWGLAAFSLYVLFKEVPFYYTTLVILSVGQLYSGLFHQDYHLWIGVLFLFGIGWAVYQEQGERSQAAFGIGFVIQSIVLVFSEGIPYYWLLALFLFLYVADDFLIRKGAKHLLKTVSILAVFIILVFQAFFLGNVYVGELTESSLYFFLVWAVLFVFAVVRSAVSSTNYYWIDLLLFVPVFRFMFGDFLSLGLLFIYALLWLISGYRQEVSRWVNKGTAAFLIATLVAYFQLAWNFLDRSLFFFLGGLLLFALSFFLEKKRRTIYRGGVEHD